MQMKTTNQEKREIKISRDFNAQPKIVFKAFSRPDTVGQ